MPAVSPQDPAISASMSALKAAMEMAEMQQAALAQMMQQMSPHLGSNVNIAV